MVEKINHDDVMDFKSLLIQKLKDEGFAEIDQVNATSGRIPLEVRNVPTPDQAFDMISPKGFYSEYRIIDLSVIDPNYKPQVTYKVFAKR
jgi:hypothetical protein